MQSLPAKCVVNDIMSVSLLGGEKVPLLGQFLFLFILSQNS